ncbi:glucan biosynthesis protein [Fodinicurvata fenggangensis]|uniref:glucan biosynthesis protein n=1 Tax=Fodinicurvata fenggangensis TaxID=1121830 RepID=UPI0004786F4A|nr:glucan biosynthesis protein D [Fodinicurvata fenggangensis]
MAHLTRRHMLQSATATAVLASLGVPSGPLWANTALSFASAQDFSFEALIARARQLAQEDYQAPYEPAPEVVQEIDYDAHGAIQFDRDAALFAEGPGVYPVTFFHLGRFFPKRVRMHMVEDGKAREILYDPDYFEMPDDSPAKELPEDSGFAGFRLHEARQRDDWKTQDWAAFLGASYFRAIGALGQYGLSARGIAVDTATAGPEEFPDFTEFYIASAPNQQEAVQVHALLEGPSVTGAFRFEIRRNDGVVMEVDSHLFTRQPIERFGISPLTSMFWYGEYNRPKMVDWRPEVHDSDGLALWTGANERIWRPLNNPSEPVVSSFVDQDPRGFGLLQRDRNPEHYLDGVNYHRRPSLWVEPLDDWGAGSVQLVELSTDDEIHDNIAAFWVPEEPVEAGQAYRFRYRLHWLEDEPYANEELAHVSATRIGRGGNAGTERPEDVWKFVVEFEGGDLEGRDRDSPPDIELSAGRGALSNQSTEPVLDSKRWRALFDLEIEGDESVELRLHLKDDSGVLSETWLYQFHPPEPA